MLPADRLERLRTKLETDDVCFEYCRVALDADDELANFALGVGDDFEACMLAVCYTHGIDFPRRRGGADDDEARQRVKCVAKRIKARFGRGAKHRT